MRVVLFWPSVKLPLDCQKIAKNLTFEKKIAKNCDFLTKNCQKQFFKKKKILAIFWQSNGNFTEGQVLFTAKFCYTNRQVRFCQSWPDSRQLGRLSLTSLRETQVKGCTKVSSVDFLFVPKFIDDYHLCDVAMYKIRFSVIYIKCERSKFLHIIYCMIWRV